MSECECPVAGYCERYKREMRGRAYQICRGEVLTPEKCQIYRENWAKLAAELPSEPSPEMRALAAKAVKCGGCGGKKEPQKIERRG